PADPKELDAGAVRVLTRAARATASFPAAFDPVDENDAQASREGYRVRGTGSGGVLIDGGVLDITPFEPLIEEIGRRQAERGRRPGRCAYRRCRTRIRTARRCGYRPARSPGRGVPAGGCGAPPWPTGVSGC